MPIIETRVGGGIDLVPQLVCDVGRSRFSFWVFVFEVRAVNNTRSVV